jgi:hypothetical protein
MSGKSRFIPWVAPLAILLVVMAWFSPWWCTGKVLAPLDLMNEMLSPWRGESVQAHVKNHIVSDSVDQYLVYRMIAADSYAHEGWLGWSNYTYGGTAEYANTMALYYDWTMQLHRWLGYWSAWHLGIMGQVLLAAYGMYSFLRGRGIQSLWACGGGLAYACNSQFVTWVYHRWALSSFCWVPWLFWAMDAYRKKSRMAWMMVPATLAMALLGGTLQHAALVLLCFSAAWLEEFFSREGKDRLQPRFHARYFVWSLLGVGLAAMMFLPCADAFFVSNKLGLHTGMTTNASVSIYPEGKLQPILNALAYPLQVFPSLLGRCDSVDVLKLFKSELFYVAYFGFLPVLVAFVAIFRRDFPLLARILILMGLLLPLTPAVRYLYQRLYLLFIFGGIHAFAHFAQNLSRTERLKWCRWLVRGMSVVVVCWLLFSIGFSFAGGLQEKIRTYIFKVGSASSYGYFSDWMAARACRFVADLFVWSPQQWIPLLSIGFSILGLYWTASEGSGRKKLGGLMMVGAVIFDVTVFAERWVVWSDPAKHPLFPETAESKALEEVVTSSGRVSTVIHPTAHLAKTPFIPNTLAAYRIATISGYDSIVPKGMILPNESPADAGKLGRMGVTHLITWAGNPDIPQDWHRVWKSKVMDLYENRMAVPYYMGWANSSQKDAFFGGRTGSETKLHETSGKLNSRSIEVPQGIRWVRVAENAASGWEYKTAAMLDWSQVSKAPDASMLMENPTPDQPTQMLMRYRPPLRMMGFRISAVCLVLVLLGQGWVWFQPRRRVNPL